MTIWRNGRKAAKSRKAHRKQKVDQDMSIQRDAALYRDNFRCVECGCTFNLQVHHIKSRGMGGDDSLGNLETLCPDCHAKRHVRPKFSGASA